MNKFVDTDNSLVFAGEETAQTEGLTERGSERRRRRCEFSELRVFRDLMEGTDRQGGGLPEQGNRSPIQTEGHTHS